MTKAPPLNINCLLVDDDQFMLITISKLLGSLGVTNIVHTDNAEDALAYLADEAHAIDVIISDLNMPGMDGIQLLRHLSKANHSHRSVILISGEDPRLLESVKGLGEHQNLTILGAIAKPIKREQLSELLAKHQPTFTPQTVVLDADTATDAVLADELQQAMQSGQLQTFYQPQVSTVDGRIIGLEALARWHHPQRGWIPPSVFVAVAEQNNLITDLTSIIFKQAIDFTTRLRHMGFNTRVSVNFSTLVLCNLELPEVLSESLTESGLEPINVMLEVTESMLAQDMGTTLDILTRMRLKGFGLSIDDFGTGFSSMEQLRQIPFTELKIDRSFVHQAADNQASRAILESSITLANKLNIVCVAEGVETQAEWDLVKSLGCDVVQGYFIAKPIAPDDYIDWVRDYANRRTELS